MAFSDPHRGTIEIREIEGAERWSAVLYGRAMPLNNTPPQFGAMGRYEDTNYRGKPTIDTEPLGVGFPPLVFSGRWGILHIRTNRSRVVFTPDQDVSSPQSICQAFKKFALRMKVCEVSWSGGELLVVRWDQFLYTTARRGPDREWSMHFTVLGDKAPQPQPLDDMLTAKTAATQLSKAAHSLDDALTGYPNGLAPNFLERIKESMGAARQKLANLRSKIQGIADLARAPADVLNNLSALAEDARNTLIFAADSYDQVALETQIALHRTENAFSAAKWKGAVKDSTDTAVGSLNALLDYVDSLQVAENTYVACNPGDNLSKIAITQYGAGKSDLWTVIADANGLSAQIVPDGVTTLLIPAVS